MGNFKCRELEIGLEFESNIFYVLQSLTEMSQSFECGGISSTSSQLELISFVSPFLLTHKTCSMINYICKQALILEIYSMFTYGAGEMMVYMCLLQHRVEFTLLEICIHCYPITLVKQVTKFNVKD